MTLGELGEFGFIDRVARIAGRAAGGFVQVGIGDDAAVVRPPRGEDLVLTTDALVEGVHFRWRNQSPGHVGARALLVSLSDLAASGARPRACLLSLAASPRLPAHVALGVVRGLVGAATREGCPLVGGNVAAADRTSLHMTAAGSVRRGRALRRDRARPGDRICVTGALGAAALALARAERRGTPLRRLPTPRVGAGRTLAGQSWIGACIDVSDGLVADLRHVLHASGAGARIDASRIPRPRGFARACAGVGVDPVRLALAGGEDYELLFTVREGAPAADVIGRRLGVAVTEIGSVSRGRGLRVAGARLRGREGWAHF